MKEASLLNTQQTDHFLISQGVDFERKRIKKEKRSEEKQKDNELSQDSFLSLKVISLLFSEKRPTG